MDEKDLKRLKKSIDDLTKAVTSMGKLMNDAILTLRRACQILEDELHNKTELIQKTDSIDIVVDGEVTQTIGVDFGVPEGETNVESYRDIMTDSDVIIYSNGGKVHQVIRQELDGTRGTREDITEQWLKDHPQEN